MKKQRTQKNVLDWIVLYRLSSFFCIPVVFLDLEQGFWGVFCLFCYQTFCSQGPFFPGKRTPHGPPYGHSTDLPLRTKEEICTINLFLIEVDNNLHHRHMDPKLSHIALATSCPFFFFF